MIQLSNLKWIADHGEVKVVCDISSEYAGKGQLWFSVADSFGDWMTSDVYDAFLVAVVYPAMYYGEDITVEGNVSKKLHFNICNYVMAIVSAYTQFAKKGIFKSVNISVKGYANAEKALKLHVGTGFSGGVDSFSTITDRYSNTDDLEYKIDSLFFFNVGQYGNVKNPLSQERARNRFVITENFAKEMDVPAIFMHTNLFDYYLPEWEYSGGLLVRIASVLVFQRGLRRYYISNTITYAERIQLINHVNPDMAEFADPYVMPLLSPEGLDILDDGEPYLRTEKVARIANNPLAWKYLNVCVNSADNHTVAKNCGYCSKCLRTLLALDTLDALDKFSEVFNITDWRKRANEYKSWCVRNYDKNEFAKDNVEFALAHGKVMPTKIEARIVYFKYNWKSIIYNAIVPLLKK